MGSTEVFLRARNFLLKNRENYEKAYREFQWPEFETFNWALDWFDVFARGNHNCALWLLKSDSSNVRITFSELSENSSRIASFLKREQIQRGDRILIMLPNAVPIWEVMLGAMKFGAVVVPTSTQATVPDLADRMNRGRIKLIVTDQAGSEKFRNIPGNYKRVLYAAVDRDWILYDDVLTTSQKFVPDGPTRSEDPLLLYFTSGTTAKPKLVLHTHRSYPVGHLSTMYWIGIQEGDIHQNISSPGWAKHAWSSFFAPWNAGATVFVHDYLRFDAAETIKILDQNLVNTLCAPPTVWRMLILESLGQRPRGLRELASAGEPLNPEVIERVQQSWGITIRDGYGQTETTAQIGNPPGTILKLGSMGRTLPGYEATLLNRNHQECTEGEIALRLKTRPAGLMQGYYDDLKRTEDAMAGDYYRTGDEATIDEEGYFRFVGRGDDVFKSSDYRISPFELESALIEHEWVAEAAVVPSPDPIRLCVPKAFVLLKPGVASDSKTAQEILSFVNSRLAPFQKIRKIEFSELPKTISGKIRRVQLRADENDRYLRKTRGPQEFWLEDFTKRLPA